MHELDYLRFLIFLYFSGKPAYEMLTTDPDWAPSLNMGYKNIATNAERAERAKSRRKQSVVYTTACADHAADKVEHDEDSCFVNSHISVENSKFVQTDLTGENIEQMMGELNNLYEEKRCLQAKVKESNMFSEDSFDGDNERDKFYTGLPSYAT